MNVSFSRRPRFKPPRPTWLLGSMPLLLVAGSLLGAARASSGPPPHPALSPKAPRTAALADFSARYCVSCHNGANKTAGLALNALMREPVGHHPEAWERVVRKLRARQMPPVDKERPDERTYEAVTASLEAALDRAAAAHPDPGRTETFRRLNATEYGNAIRDLLSLEIDAGALLPRDPSSNRFDNVTVTDLSPTLMDRYVTAAQKISRLAVGSPGRGPGGDTIRLPADRTQEEHVPGLPLGTRGGTLIPYTFPTSGEYEIAVRLSRDRNEEVEGLKEPHELEMLLDRGQVGQFTVRPPRGGEGHANVDAQLKQRIRVTAGPHALGITFLKKPSELLETKRQPYQAHFNLHRHPRLSPAVYQISITGPYGVSTPGDTPSRRRIFSSRPATPADEEPCARRILSRLMRRAYRRPVTEADLRTPLKVFRQARAGGSFEGGIEAALSAVLVSPNFLFHIERDPSGAPPRTAYAVSDVELASRLSFFLWSSIPDETLLGLAERGQLHRPEVLSAQVRRMLKDSRAGALTTNFAAQWLHLRNLDAVTPDLREFPDFDDNLRQSFRKETELLFESIVREDRNVADLLTADYTYLNERLARHYGIPYVYGSRFRRVSMSGEHRRGGLLRQGSILTVTSYATRTSPVLRGKWVLDNLLGMPPSPPPANVPALKDNTVAANLTVHERLAAHRANPACWSCHSAIDPVGFSLEQFDAIGRWRDVEEGRPVDAAGGLPDGSRFVGVSGLEGALRRRPELFVHTLAENLLMFGVGRNLEDGDAPAIRSAVRQSRASGYRFSSLVTAIANSVPFRMTRTE